MTDRKLCFVVMPILGEGTTEHAHFRALFDEVIKPALEPLGYDVKRSDDYKKGGAITKDIIVPLAAADLVVADLTDLNANVFYELGIRHSLRGTGTIMIMDDRQERIPFDVGAYRVIRFKGDLAGIGKLRRELIAFAHGQNDDDEIRRDNPVHDWLPSLPVNALEASRRSTDGELRARIAHFQDIIRQYQDRFGKVVDGASVTGPSPVSVVMEALAEVTDGNSPAALMDLADSAITARDDKTFLNVIRRVLELKVAKPTVEQFLSFGQKALVLDLRSVATAITEHARTIYPKNRELRRHQLELFAHSDDPAIRERARRELMDEIGMRVSEERIIVPDQFIEDSRPLYGIMLDAFHADGLNDQALRITDAFVSKFPNMTVVLRNRARALENSGKGDEALVCYQKAVSCADCDDTSAIWFGSELHNRERHVDAAEIYARACLFDANDARGFAHLADEMSWAVTEGAVKVGSHTDRQLPQGFQTSMISRAVDATLSCEILRAIDLERVKRALARIDAEMGSEIHLASGEERSAAGAMSSSHRMTKKQRVEFALEVCHLFASELTQEVKLGHAG